MFGGHKHTIPTKFTMCEGASLSKFYAVLAVLAGANARARNILDKSWFLRLQALWIVHK